MMAPQHSTSSPPPPYTAEALGRPILLNNHIREFLSGYPKQDWPKVVEYVLLYGIRSLFSTYPPGSIVSTADLENVTSTARRDVASLSPQRRPRKPPADLPLTTSIASSPPRASTPLVDTRKPRADALYHYPFVDDQGTVEEVLSDGQQWSFFDLDSREQERISKKVFEEIKTGVLGLSLDDLPYALRCVGLNLSDNQVHRLFPRLYARHEDDQPLRTERPVTFSQWLAILGTLRSVLRPASQQERQGNELTTPAAHTHRLYEKSVQTETDDDSPIVLPPPPPPKRRSPPAPKGKTSAPSPRRPGAVRGVGEGATKTKKPVAAKTRRTTTDKATVPRSLRHVQSKIKPQLDAHREHQRKVREARDEALFETIAARRLKKTDPLYASYKEQLHGELGSGGGARRRATGASTRLRSSGPGANAREIAEAFLDSPLMSQLSEGGVEGGARAAKEIEEEEEDEELSTFALRSRRQEQYEDRLSGGAAAASGAASSTASERRSHEQWLGDYGPLHTRTLRSAEWTGGSRSRATEDDDEEEKENGLAAYREYLNEAFRQQREEIKRRLRRVREQEGEVASSLDAVPGDGESRSSSSSSPSCTTEESSLVSAVGSHTLMALSPSEQSVEA